jgi:high-affinity iron transporter
MFSDYFSIALFFVIFRETLEITIILSVLLAFIDRLSLPDASILKSMRRMVWLGTLSATVIVVAIGSALISIW